MQVLASLERDAYARREAKVDDANVIGHQAFAEQAGLHLAAFTFLHGLYPVSCNS